MLSQKDEQMENTLQVTQEKVQQKQYAYSIAESEYNKLYNQSEKYSKILDEIKEKKYNLENMLKTCESRLVEFEKSDKDFEKELAAIRKSVETLKLEVQNSRLNDNKEFNNEVMQLVQKLCIEREMYCKGTLNDEIQGSYEEKNAYEQEVEYLLNISNEIKSNYPLSDTFEELNIKCCKDQWPLIKEEIEKEKLKNKLFDSKQKVYELKKATLLQEIQKIEQQL